MSSTARVVIRRREQCGVEKTLGATTASETRAKAKGARAITTTTTVTTAGGSGGADGGQCSGRTNTAITAAARGTQCRIITTNTTTTTTHRAIGTTTSSSGTGCRCAHLSVTGGTTIVDDDRVLARASGTHGLARRTGGTTTGTGDRSGAPGVPPR